VAPTPTGTATAVSSSAFTFAVEAAKIGYASSDPTKVFHRPSLSRIKVGQRVKLILYAKLSGIGADASVSVGFRVTEKGKTILLTRGTHAVTPADNGQDLDWTHYFTPRTAGSFTFAGTLFVGSHHRHKSISFSVATG
jgi:hypothetical protein